MAKQFYKALYFNDFPSSDTKDKSITLAFTELETSVYSQVKEMSTQEIKELIGFKSYKQLSTYADKEERSINQTVKRLIKQKLANTTDYKDIGKKEVTFTSSKDLPFQRWYPYIEGYSPDFVKSLIAEHEIGEGLIYEPFAGTGTTIFASDELSLKTVYTEVNPLLQFLIDTKIKVLQSPRSNRKKIANALQKISQNLFDTVNKYPEDKMLKDSYSTIFADSKYFSDTTLSDVLKFRTFIDTVKLEDELVGNILTVAVISCLLPVSFLKKSGDVRFKTDKELKNELKTFEQILPQKIEDIIEDVLNFDKVLNTKPEFLFSNAKDISRTNSLKIGAIITSPPYLNGTNYFRNTKLELWFLKLLRYENDLRFFRDQALTSGINDVKKEYAKTIEVDILSKSDLLKQTLVDLSNNAYDSRIPLMAKSYFEEMYLLFRDTRNYLLENSKILIDIGDSIFCDIHIKTDIILIELLEELGYSFLENKLLRKRRSRNKQILSQNLLVFSFSLGDNKLPSRKPKQMWLKNWKDFKTELPHQQEPFVKRNWGHSNHSLCSYQGKLKPAIAHNLVKTFVPVNGSVLDPFSGVGTIPFEAALSGKKSYGLDISLPAYIISQAKVFKPNLLECYEYLGQLQQFISSNICSENELAQTRTFGFNKTLAEYYELETLKEILLARRFLNENFPNNPSQMLVIACLLHVLHGNRPYALSRNSHPIVPYAPSGDYVYKSLIKSVTEKLERAIKEDLPEDFQAGKIFHQDTTAVWPQEINNLDAIITSPPFFDSTRFHLANWIRIWFSGWSENDFKFQPNSFVDEKQKKDFDIYESIFRQSKERLKTDGVCVLHLGKSVKCDMARELQKVSKRWFKTADLFDESVEHCESHGFKDKGSVTSHQYLVLV